MIIFLAGSPIHADMHIFSWEKVHFDKLIIIYIYSILAKLYAYIVKSLESFQ